MNRQGSGRGSLHWEAGMFRRDCSRESSGRRGRRGLHRGSDCQEAGEREDFNPRPMGPHLAPQAQVRGPGCGSGPVSRPVIESPNTGHFLGNNGAVEGWNPVVPGPWRS